MSTDPHGIIYYGIDIGKIASEKYRVVDYDYHGINDKWDSEHQPTRPTSTDYKSPEWDEWRIKLRAYEATPEHVEMRWFGAEDCERFVVHCCCLEMRVEYDEQIDLGHRHLSQQPDADKWIEKFCNQFDLPYVPPTWHLASLYF
jgi:hypothetical protein